MGSVSASDDATASSSTVSSPSVQPHTSPWQSPVPYLFGGLAAVLCIIMFSLLMLAFSYRRQSGSHGGIEAQKQIESGVAESVHASEPKILVIMAGDEHPTYLATPVCATCSSLAEGSDEEGFEKGEENHESSQKTDKQAFDHVASSSTAQPENGGAPASRQHNP
ncbi:protein GLUTAMINE DUMPER 5-like [Neltuma alba]|uniref:protein GLUTAMINE DUMPER 5-like n=1 Tax=Neltuma alba TaxID=207710 RepID=UPI0010A3B695|nr:protein GLUTAMINE DUMPER 5-like [Prosopis alba]